MKKIILVIAGLLLVTGVAAFGIKVLFEEDSWICQNGEWMKHGNPSTPRPSVDCGVEPTKTQIYPVKNIIVESPKEGEKVASLLRISGQARVFENMFNYRLKDEKGLVLTEGTLYANAPDIGQFGPFEKEVTFPKPKTEKGILEVFDYSAKDDSEIDKATINLTFK